MCGAALAALGAFTLAVLGAAWYVSGRVIAVAWVSDSYPLRVVASDQRARLVVLTRGPDAAEPGSFRLAWRGGHVIVGAVVGGTRTTVSRRILGSGAPPRVGAKVGIEPDRFAGNPASALGYRYRVAMVPTAVGGMPAWYLAGRRRTWAILIHGLGGSRRDTLPAMPLLRALGFPVLAISYRNDPGAPQSRDHRSRLGAAELRDVAAAVEFAIRHAARGVVLYGWSMGGLLALRAARDPAVAPNVRAIVLDSPLLDWPATLDYWARRHGIPRLFAALTEAVIAWRAGIDYAQFDALRHEAQLRPPVLLIQGTADTVVPPALATRFARARPSLVTYVPVADADHVSAIDTAPRLYAAALRNFLAPFR